MSLVSRFFSVEGRDPLSTVDWETREHKGRTIEVPTSWSELAGRVVADKYMRGIKHADGIVRRETSVRQVLRRVCGTIARWAYEQGVLSTEDSLVFRDELLVLCVTQRMAFNSPVWFNVGTTGGIQGTEQCSACFINSVEDNMDDILDVGVREGRIYKHGSGSGINYSKLRSSREALSTTGTASGPVPFIAKDDANAGAIKSGGTTRRAAKMVILNVDHGDIMEFIVSKQLTEKAAKALVAAGFDSDFRARFGAYGLLPFQNGNHSVRVPDAFMHAVRDDKPWDLLARDGTVLQTVRARKLWDLICVAAHECGCPGLQFDTQINEWHTCAVTARINASNPCSEYMFLDDSACNLASLNLRKFQLTDNSWNIPAYIAAIDTTILAQEVLVNGSAYPTERITANSHRFRPLGLGYANLGSALMCGLMPYDSDRGRSEAAALTALMGGRAYYQSARIAQRMGAFDGYAENREVMLAVIQKHANAAADLQDGWVSTGRPTALVDAACRAWRDALTAGTVHGFRNSQTTVLAPTGTISFMMDCDTTGVEPDIALRREKHMVGGGTETLVSEQVPEVLRRLGYAEEDIKRAEAQILARGSVHGIVREEDEAIFDCAYADELSGRCISPEGHIDMMAAVQPFLSGAISKTVNLPAGATVAEVGTMYQRAWLKGVKAVAIYRDGSKGAQPVTTTPAATAPAVATAPVAVAPVRQPLPDDVPTTRHKVTIGDVELFIHAGIRPGDGTVGEVFLRAATQGTIVNGLLDGIGRLLSLTLQYGVPLEELSAKFVNTRFEPSGFTGKAEIPSTTSILDYVFRHLNNVNRRGLVAGTPAEPPVDRGHAPAADGRKVPGSACPSCGATAVRTGSCLTCPSCLWAGGCG